MNFKPGMTLTSLIEESNKTMKKLGYDMYRDLVDICDDKEMTSLLIENYTADIKSAHDKAIVTKLMEHAADNIVALHEEGVATIGKVASLSFPVIRKLWATVGIKSALKEYVAETPSFVIQFARPYVLKADANGKAVKQYIIGGEASKYQAIQGKPTATRGVQTIANGASSTVDFSTAASGLDVGTALVSGATSTIKVQDIEKVRVAIIELDAGATWDSAAGTGVGVGYTQNLSEVASGETDINGTVTIVKDGKMLAFAKVDNNAGTVVVVNTSGAAISVVVDAEISQEFHETPTTVSIEYTKRECNVPTGEHFSSVVTTESTQDLRAMYNIDNVAELVNNLTNLVAENLEIELKNFLIDAVVDRATPEYDYVGGSDKFTFVFDCQMKDTGAYLQNPNYALSASSWRSEVTKTIDYAATKIIMEMHYKVGTFKVVGNPLDIMLIPNINWEIKNGEAVDGAEVSYAKGYYQGAFTYQLISSPYYPQGAIDIFFIPGQDEKALTYVYYPYSFNTETSGYRNNAHTQVPSIMCTKRHTIEKFMPASARVTVLNNTFPQ